MNQKFLDISHFCDWKVKASKRWNPATKRIYCVVWLNLRITIFHKIYFLVYDGLSYHRSSQLIIYLFHNFLTQTENVKLKIYKAEQTQEEMFFKSSSDEFFCFCFNFRKYKEFFAIKFSTNSLNGNGLKRGKFWLNENLKANFTF